MTWVFMLLSLGMTFAMLTWRDIAVQARKECFNLRSALDGETDGLALLEAHKWSAVYDYHDGWKVGKYLGREITHGRSAPSLAVAIRVAEAVRVAEKVVQEAEAEARK